MTLARRLHREPLQKGKNGIVSSFVARRKKYLLAKRITDLVISVVVITAVLSWLIPLLALLIRLNSPGPVFFVQKRVGLNGKLFSCIKFRTMVRNDEADHRPASEDDERVTSIGRFLRRSNIDELPQFFNVLFGHMSVVGPRPHMPSDCTRFTFVIPSYPFRQQLRPGITGWAQVNGYHGFTMDYESIALRYYWDAQYVRRANYWLDFKILFSTVKISLKALFSPQRAA